MDADDDMAGHLKEARIKAAQLHLQEMRELATEMYEVYQRLMDGESTNASEKFVVSAEQKKQIEDIVISFYRQGLAILHEDSNFPVNSLPMAFRTNLQWNNFSRFLPTEKVQNDILQRIITKIQETLAQSTELLDQETVQAVEATPEIGTEAFADDPAELAPENDYPEFDGDTEPNRVAAPEKEAVNPYQPVPQEERAEHSSFLKNMLWRSESTEQVPAAKETYFSNEKRFRILPLKPEERQYRETVQRLLPEGVVLLQVVSENESEGDLTHTMTVFPGSQFYNEVLLPGGVDESLENEPFLRMESESEVWYAVASTEPGVRLEFSETLDSNGEGARAREVMRQHILGNCIEEIILLYGMATEPNVDASDLSDQKELYAQFSAGYKEFSARVNLAGLAEKIQEFEAMASQASKGNASPEASAAYRSIGADNVKEIGKHAAELKKVLTYFYPEEELLALLAELQNEGQNVDFANLYFDLGELEAKADKIAQEIRKKKNGLTFESDEVRQFITVTRKIFTYLDDMLDLERTQYTEAVYISRQEQRLSLVQQKLEQMGLTFDISQAGLSRNFLLGMTGGESLAQQEVNPVELLGAVEREYGVAVSEIQQFLTDQAGDIEWATFFPPAWQIDSLYDWYTDFVAVRSNFQETMDAMTAYLDRIVWLLSGTETEIASLAQAAKNSLGGRSDEIGAHLVSLEQKINVLQKPEPEILGSIKLLQREFNSYAERRKLVTRLVEPVKNILLRERGRQGEYTDKNREVKRIFYRVLEKNFKNTYGSLENIVTKTRITDTTNDRVTVSELSRALNEVFDDVSQEVSQDINSSLGLTAEAA